PELSVSDRAGAGLVRPSHSPLRRAVPRRRGSAPRPGGPATMGPAVTGARSSAPPSPEPVITAPPSREPRPHGRGYAAILRCFRHGNDRGRPRWRYYCRSRWRLTVLFGFEFTASGRRTGDSPGSTR